MIDGWRITSISNICKINQSTYSILDKWEFVNYLDTSSIVENNIDSIQHFIIGKDKLPSRARRKVNVDDILYSTVRPNQRHYGIMKDVLTNMLVSTGFAVITTDKLVADSNFIYYYLTQNDIVNLLHSIAEQSVSTYPSIKPSDIGKLKIILPPLEEQQKIGQLLKILDDKIELNKKINKTLEEMAKAIFKSWFVDFEPWGGKMPDDWKEVKLGDIANITTGKRPKLRMSTVSMEAYIPIIGASSVMGFTSDTLYNEKILITGRVGTHGVIQRFCSPCWPSDNTLVIKTEYYEFVYQQLCIVKFYNMNRGSTQPLITQTDMRNIPIILPNYEFLKIFEVLIGQLMDLYDHNIFESTNLSSIRDTLLPKLMSGEIRVK
ncbi:type I restriction/modification specificity protein [Candidatus Arthromitus sp. SFB-mouse-Japan]|uniref:restriction endonuclease subunit S n=1 Tax=Candidatus Arthromitus sp. SFB-mouse TaxID=49118 RepID=UPI00021B7FE8|nr:restriction endonuclease subunit S [Candidatus Arthromitus sp. SFB-mouse]EIA22378.1 Type I restriction-modification system DNA methylase [Candidatus Arthromitus sp. SFB-1]EIA26475.1 Type I restriction-modification system DNA methylase [Candidatus Arthromitus sp. SFB-4]EIA28707.1 Type I restriction-modification system DNA methylase [Candidatus Arthromitus sp. SFB-co]EIA31464.1 Type I restriction-modification system DNA methylase [Candidatus Arthromitus sp. SFB-mouse-SU]EGX28031.1 type I rest